MNTDESLREEILREDLEQDALLDAKFESDVESFAKSLEDYIAQLKGKSDWDSIRNDILGAMADEYQLPWFVSLPGYISNSDAVTLIEKKFPHVRLNLQKLNKLIKQGGIHFMRQGQRCRVNLQELEEMSKRLYDCACPSVPV